MTKPWKELSGTEKGALIRPMILDGLMSYAQIGRIVGASRVAVAGAANRNNIVSPYSAQAREGIIGSKGATANKARQAGSIAATRRAKGGKHPTAPRRPAFIIGFVPPEDKRPQKPDAWKALPDTTPKPLFANLPSECTWPIDMPDGRMLFCCQPITAERGSWCDAHRAIGYRPTPALKLKGRKKS